MSLANLSAKETAKKLASNTNFRNLLASNLPSHLKHKILAMSLRANIARQAAQVGKVKARKNQNIINQGQVQNMFRKAANAYHRALYRGTITPLIRREYVNTGRRWANLLPSSKRFLNHLAKVEAGVNNQSFHGPDPYVFNTRAEKGNFARNNTKYRAKARLNERERMKKNRFAGLRRLLSRT